MKVWSRVVTAAAVVAIALSAAAAYAATPSPKPPGAPRNLKAVAGDEQVTLTWSAPSTGPAVNYNIITTPADYPRSTTSGTTLTAIQLHNGTAYTFAVRASNGSLFGPASRVTATPHPIPPGAPTSLAATPGPGNGQYLVSWAAPTSWGSSPSGSPPAIYDHYTVKISPSQPCAPADQFSCIASNIPDNLSSSFSVTATNSRQVTGPAATVFAPLPSSATIGLQPTAGVLSASITATGQSFLASEAITLYWDGPSHVAASVVTDANGAFTKVVKPFQTDKPKVHKLCASVPPKPCANFTLQAPPTPSPPQPSSSPDQSPSPSPGPSGNPQASGARSGGGSGLDFITKPPFVFLPIIVILGLLGALAYWALSSRRRPVPQPSATVVHRATRPDYMAPFPSAAQSPPVPPAVPPPTPPGPPAVQPPPIAPAVAPSAPPLPPVPPPPVPPAQPLPPVQWPQSPPPAAPPAAPSPPPPPTWPATPDEPPDLPEPSD